MNTYEERYVAFIDVLGFKNLIKRSETDPETLKNILDALALVEEYIQTMQMDTRDVNVLAMEKTGFRVTTFSDSIVISTKANGIGISFIMTCVSLICISLLCKGIFVRGGISKGKMIHKDQITIGNGLINAYEIESKCAIYPRVIIEPSIVFDLERIEAHESQPSILRKRDFDGLWYIDMLDRTLVSIVTPLFHVNEQSLLITVKSKIEKELIGQEDISIKSKIMWLARYFNESVEHYGDKSLIIHL